MSIGVQGTEETIYTILCRPLHRESPALHVVVGRCLLSGQGGSACAGKHLGQLLAELSTESVDGAAGPPVTSGRPAAPLRLSGGRIELVQGPQRRGDGCPHGRDAGGGPAERDQAAGSCSTSAW